MEKDHTAAEAVRTALHQDLVSDAMAEVQVDGAISLRGPRLALERRTGIYLTPYKDVIRRVAELCVHNGRFSGDCQDRRCDGPTCGNTHCARHSGQVHAAACKREAVEMITSTTSMGSASGRGSFMFTQLADEFGSAKVEPLPERLFWEKGDLQAKGWRLTEDVGKKRTVSGTIPFGSSAVALQERVVRIRARAAKHVLETHNMQQTECRDVPDGTAVAVQELSALSKGSGFEDKDDRHETGRHLAEVLGMTCMFAGWHFERRLRTVVALSLTFDPGGWVSRSESGLGFCIDSNL